MTPSEKRRRYMQSAKAKGSIAIDEEGKPILFQRTKKQKGYLIKELTK